MPVFSSETVRFQYARNPKQAHPSVLKHADCAKSHGISMGTVANIVRKYNDDGIDSVITLKRSVNSDHARRKVDGRAEAMIIATTKLVSLYPDLD